MDYEAMGESSTMGQVQGHATHRDPGLRGVRTSSKPKIRRSHGPSCSELEEQDPGCLTAGRLVKCMVLDGHSGPIGEKGVGCIEGGNVSGLAVHQRVGEIEETCEGSRGSDLTGPRRSGGGRASPQMTPGDLLHGLTLGCREPLMFGRQNSKFVQFYSWQEGAHSALPRLEGKRPTSLFPCLLPYPEVFYSGKSGVAELGSCVWAMRYLNAFTAWCNFVELGCPSLEGGVYEPLGAFQPEELARDYADKLLGEVMKLASLELINGKLEFQSGRRAVEEAFNQVKCTASGFVFDSVEDSLTELQCLPGLVL